MEAPGFWDDPEAAQKVNKQLKSVNDRIEHYESLKGGVEDTLDLCQMVSMEYDDEMAKEIETETQALEERVEQLRLATMLKGEYDHNDAILSLHAGAGGTEAQDWTQMLYRMYTRYCEKKGYEIKLLDLLEGDEAGIKSVSFEVSGEDVYGYLKAEKGVHLSLIHISSQSCSNLFWARAAERPRAYTWIFASSVLFAASKTSATQEPIIPVAPVINMLFPYSFSHGRFLSCTIACISSLYRGWFFSPIFLSALFMRFSRSSFYIFCRFRTGRDRCAPPAVWLWQALCFSLSTSCPHFPA